MSSSLQQNYLLVIPDETCPSERVRDFSMNVEVNDRFKVDRCGQHVNDFHILYLIPQLKEYHIISYCILINVDIIFLYVEVQMNIVIPNK